MMEFSPTIFQGSNPTSIFLSSDNEFEDTDVIVDSDSVMGQGQNTIVNIIVNEPGENKPVLPILLKMPCIRQYKKIAQH